MASPEFNTAAAHRHFSAECFNRVWELLDKCERSADDNELMISMCHASLFHWLQRSDCADRNLSIGYWQLSRVYAVAGYAERARHYAGLCETKSLNECPFLLAYAYESGARAESLSGQLDAARELVAKARALAGQVSDIMDRQTLEQDLDTIVVPAPTR